MTRSRRYAVIALAALIFAAGVVGIVTQMIEPPNDSQTRVAQFLYLLNPIVTSVLGGYLSVVRPRHPAGWLLLFIAAVAVVDSMSKAALNAGPGTLALGLREWGGWLDNWVWVFLFGGVCLLMQTFPDGRLAGPRWRILLTLTIVVVLAEGAVCSVAHGVGAAKLTPAFVPRLIPEQAAGAGFLGILVVLIGSVATLFVRRHRYRRTGDAVGVAQLRWLLWAAGIVLVTLVVGAIADQSGAGNSIAGDVADIASQLAFYGFPVAFVAAVTRHGLFEIDRVVSRTVSYAVVTGVLLGIYIGIIAGLSAFLPTNVNSVVVAAATLAVAALFVPVRRAVQGRVDRRFNRRRHDRTVLVERFADQLRRDVAHGSDGADLLTVVHRALEPMHAGLWLVPQ